MVKGRVAPQKCSFHVATQTENQYTLIDQLTHMVLLKFIIILFIALHDVNIAEVYNVYDMSLLSYIV